MFQIVISIYISIMTIEELKDIVKGIALDDLELKSFYIGNTWDHAAGKRDLYPCLWLEMPIFSNYQISGKLYKTFSFAVAILAYPSLDDLESELAHISEAEVNLDKFLQYLKTYGLNPNPQGITIKSVNADNACGIRCDIDVTTVRECLSS